MEIKRWDSIISIKTLTKKWKINCFWYKTIFNFVVTTNFLEMRSSPRASGFSQFLQKYVGRVLLSPIGRWIYWKEIGEFIKLEERLWRLFVLAVSLVEFIIRWPVSVVEHLHYCMAMLVLLCWWTFSWVYKQKAHLYICFFAYQKIKTVTSSYGLISITRLGPA